MLKTIKKLWMDESGDCGFKFNTGSSKFFVLAAVYIATLGDNDIAVVDEAIKKLKIQHNLIENFEFKFSHCKEKFRKEFFQTITQLPIEYKAIIVEKTKISSPILRHQPQQLYCETARMLFYDNNPPLESAVLLIDEAIVKIHHKEFNWVLKNYLSKNTVSRIKQKSSRKEIMIQVADMIAGAIFREHSHGDQTYHKMIKGQEKILIKF